MSAMNIYACSVGCNFMKNFVANLCSGNILREFNINNTNLFGLADIEIFVPTRRAARALTEEFIAQGQEVFFLPKIIAFSDIDCANEVKSQLPTIGNIERILLLSRLIYSWKRQIAQYSQLGDAIWLAQDLAALIDEAFLSKVNWHKLNDIEAQLNSELSQWWQLSSNFLQIAATQYPIMLKEKNVLDIGESLALKFSVKAQQIKNDKSGKAYIVLGATGAVPCVADFLKTVAIHPNGAIILPSLDRDLSANIWKKFADIKEISLYGQAQYNYFKLLKKLNVKREDIRFIGTVSNEMRWRERYVTYALMPAESTDCWHNIDKTYSSQAFENVSIIEAEEEREEALAIACALRIAAHNPNKKVALITSNRNLARRVSAELARFGVIANDSAQQPFFSLDFGRWLQLILLNITDSDVNIFLALLRHPLTSLGLEPEKLKLMLDLYEKHRLRGAVLRFSFLDFSQLNQQMFEQWLQREEDSNCDAVSLELISELIERLSYAIEPLRLLLQKSTVNIVEALKAFITSIEFFGKDIEGNITSIYEQPGADAFAQLCEEILASDIDINFVPLEFSSIFEALANTIQIEAKAVYSNIHIWGVIEARLQYADTVVIGGLNENQFPLMPKASVFLSYSAMMHIGLEPPEVQIGASALEFQYHLGMPEVILSRSKMVDGIAQTTSRWLQRLQTVIGCETAENLKQKGQRYLHYATGLDIEDLDIKPCSAPECKPPITMRPKRFSISDIEMLQISPYAIYAKKILKLKYLKELAKIPDAAEKGSLYHDIVSRFCQDKGEINEYDKNFKKIAKICFAEKELPTDIAKLWQNEINKISSNFLADEKNYKLEKTYIELTSKLIPIGRNNAFIHGRADRIDIIKEGSRYKAEIIDYKTGAIISQISVNELIKPQLLLEANLLLRGGFDISESPLAIENIYYIYLKDDEKSKIGKKIAVKNKSNLQDLIDKCWLKTENLIDSYFDINKAYISYIDASAIDIERNPYHHLTRYDEWSR